MPVTIVLLLILIVLILLVLVFLIPLVLRYSRKTSNELIITLNDVADELLRADLSVEGLCELVYNQVQEIVPVPFFQIGLFEGHAYQVMVWVRDGNREPQKRFAEAGQKGIIGWVYESGQPLLVRDFASERLTLPAFPEFDLPEPPQSGLFIPLIAGEHTIGVLALQSRRSRYFHSRHLRLVTALANQAAWSIRNAQLYEQSQRDLRRFEALVKVSQVVVSTLNQEQLLGRIVEQIVNTFKYDRIHIFTMQDQRVIFRAGAGSHSAMWLAEGLSYPVDSKGLIPRVARTGQPVLSGDVSEIDEYLPGPQLEDTRSEMVIPVTFGSTILGVIDLQSEKENAFTSDDLVLMQALADTVAVAIRNAASYDAERRRRALAEEIGVIGQHIISESESGHILVSILDALSRVVKLNNASIFLLDKEAETLTLAASIGDELLSEAVGEQLHYEVLELEKHKSLEVAITRLYHVLLNIQEDETHDTITAPLADGNKITGYLLVNHEHSTKYVQDDVEIVKAFTNQAAVAINSAILKSSADERERLDQEIEFARSIQASFIPDEPPQIPGWQLAAEWRAARQVSGDFYDFIPLKDGKWGLVIADVADKGVPAALFMTMCRTLLRAAAGGFTSPAATLQRVNRLLFDDASTDLFITLFYGIWNPESGELLFCSAGHMPSLYSDTMKHTVEELSCKGIALGIVRDIELEERHIVIKPGDMLLAYTDGVTEAMRADYMEWGGARLLHTVKQVRDETPENIISRIMFEIDEFISGAPQSDDLTLWCLQRSTDNQ